MKGAEGIIPSWRAFASTKTRLQILWRQQESSHQLQPTLAPDQGSQLNDSLVRIFSAAKTERRRYSQSSLGSMLIRPLCIFFRATHHADSIYSNTYSALMGSEQKHYQLCLIARGFLNSSGPRMGLFPTNPLSLPRVWGDRVPVNMAFDVLPPLWSHSHPNHVQLLGEEGGVGDKGISESRKTNP